MHKIKVGVVFGGMSTEHDVSIVSGTAILNNLDKSKYEIYAIYINKEGNWYNCKNLNKKYIVGEEIKEKQKINNIQEFLKKFDVIFPALHGLYGEDGTLQGLFELIKIPYVGCKVLSSSLSMDKVYTKIVFEKAGINQAKYEYIKKYKNKYIYISKEFEEKLCTLQTVCEILEEKLKYPVFVKPSNSGSSVGINKANNIKELKESIEYASLYDKKILIEENVIGTEVECAILGNEEVKASCLGEIIPAEQFYTYDAKYKNSESKTIIPAKINGKLTDKIRNMAIKAFKAVDGTGISRVDFFVNKQTEEIYINEINTLPGFTYISMYPKLWEKSGIEYAKLLDELINLAIEK